MPQIADGPLLTGPRSARISDGLPHCHLSPLVNCCRGHSGWATMCNFQLGISIVIRTTSQEYSGPNRKFFFGKLPLPVDEGKGC